ncbi:1-phosphatidylinositol 4-kinase [Ceraceosorus bombacis]|uniref:1-phosphatidylinositol 4-kinase n=1 Tax=Ceraceosorus bombacis TaxID=401625 RepID=A0A0P1BKU6_9BASI|nr:1-phosphatidylinositol 4-kinase [Ceraceosorus bombacis]
MSLLLRLFESAYFTPQLAVSYLDTYAENVGITYYLVDWLRKKGGDSVDFYWPQICYLLITRPSESRALECFVLQRCDESVHVALLTLWHFQAALSDLSATPQSPSFAVCQRIFNACQRILFNDPLSSASLVVTSSSSSSAVGSGRRRRMIVAAGKRVVAKVLPSNPKASAVGIGAVLASVPGMPELAHVAGTIAIEQGRRRPLGLDRAGLEGDAGPQGDSSDEAEFSDVDEAEESQPGEDSAPTSATSTSKIGAASGQLTAATAVSERQPVGPARTATAPRASTASSGGILKTPINGKASSSNPFATFASRFDAGFNEFRGKAAAAVGDALGQTLGVEFVPGPTPAARAPKPPPAWHPQRRPRPSLQRQAARFRSVPNLAPGAGDGSMSPFASTAALPSVEDTPQSADTILTQYDEEARRRLLRSNYCREQTQFLLTLQDISARLLLIPKPARVSALRAELTQLNHRLPSEVCFPLWCRADVQDGRETSAASIAAETGAATVAPDHAPGDRHHRVVRINPSEAVVLNSADRAPFLLHVEILHDDLDFDPQRRQNRESLRKLVLQEDTRRRKFALSRSFSHADSSKETIGSRRDTTEGTANSSSQPTTPSAGPPGTPHAELRTLAPDAAISRGKTPPLPTRVRTPMPEDDGEEIDLTEQAYGSDLAAFGEVRDPESDEEDLTTMNRVHDTAAWTSTPDKEQSGKESSTKHATSGSSGNNRAFSLDEYSERMKTAAVMLAQLNRSTNAAAQPIVVHNPHVSATAQGGWSSWLIGTSWASNNSSGSPSEAGQGSAGIKAPVNGSTAPAAPRASTAGSVTEGLQQALSIGTASTGTSNAAATSAKVMHTDTEAIRRRIMQEMMALEEERMERMKVAPRNMGRTGRGKRGGAGRADEDEATVMRAVNKDDPSAAIFRESWAAKKSRIRASSPYGHLDSWDVFSVIVKTGADLRQEQLAVQLIAEFGRIWKETGSRCWVRYFRVLVTSENSGLMETVTDAVSVHSIRKEAYTRRVNEGKLGNYSLYDHFVETFGDSSSSKFGKARERFMESLAAYSIISYLLQIKDRHNGNILIDGEGHVIHIDFGFMLGISPGGVGFEAAPFKLSQDYIDIIGGLDSPKFAEFKALFQAGFRDVRKHAERIIMMVQLMQRGSKLPCFSLGELTASNLRDRFQLALSSSQCDAFAERLVESSANSVFTRLYDTYQYHSQGVL